MNLKGVLKRFIIYPMIVGFALHFFISNMAEMTPDNIEFPVITFYTKFFSFLSLPDSFITTLSYYFLGYGFGLISTFLSVRKLKIGFFLSLFITIAKVSFVIVNCIVLPFIFAFDLLFSVIRFLYPSKKKRAATINPIQYEEKNAL